jgi:hypothetical protein
MQTLGLSDSTPRTESRFKSLFWPSIQTASDLDYLGVQGYWVCAAVAGISLVVLVISGQPMMGSFVFLFYYLSGVGVRERSRYAAAAVLLMYVADMLTSRPTALRIIMAALLLSNLRATWIASRWKPDSEEAVLPPRLAETWSDKFADQLPTWLWPKARILYYVLSACFMALTLFGLITLMRSTPGKLPEDLEDEDTPGAVHSSDSSIRPQNSSGQHFLVVS